MEKQVKNLLSLIKITPPLIIMIVSIFIINLLNTQQQKELTEERDRIEKQFIEDEKTRIEANVLTVYNLIKDEDININIELKKNLKLNGNNVYAIINNIYKTNINKKTKDEIVKEIKVVLRDLRFNYGRTYVALTNSKALTILQPLKPESEGKHVYNLQDKKGKYLLREILDIAKSPEKEGFIEYYFHKLTDKKTEHKKLTYVKVFKELDLVITIGDYIDDFKRDTQNKILKQFPQLKYKKDAHLYVITFEGDIIYHPSNKAINTNIFKEDKYNHMDYLFKDLILKKEKDSAVFINIKPKVVESIDTKDTKVNYVKRFDDWGWMIGVNFNISSAHPIIVKRKTILEKKYDNYKNNILFYGIILTLIILILSYFMSKVLEKKFLTYKENIETKNKKLELQSELLKQKKDEFETIIKEAPNPIMIHNEDGKVIMINQVWIEASGFSLEEIPTIDNWINYVYKDEQHRAAIKKHIFSLYEITGRINEGEFQFTNKNGNLVSWQFFSAPLGLIDGKRTIISSAMDITEEKNKDKLLFEQTKLASMGEMIGNIAHQWRQPLSIISMGVTGMKMQKEMGVLDNDTFNKNCDIINNNAQYLSKTIDDFRNFIKGERNKQVYNLKDSISSFLHLVEGTIKKHEIILIQDISQDININGYENELIQGFINIFNNAKDALQKIDSEKDTRIVFISTSIQNNNAVINIKDNAGGIPQEILAKIFEPYFTTKHSSQGTGLGLHMTYNLIVDGMGGNIEAHNTTYTYKNKEYKGAEFTITLPVNHEN